MTPSSERPREAPATPFRELDRVRLSVDAPDADSLIPAGTMGTIVHRYANASAYEVEVVTPRHAVLTVKSGQIEPA